MFSLSAKPTRRLFVSCFCALAVVPTCAIVARSRSHYQPVIILPPTSITAGQPASCYIETDGGPEAVTIYSSPSGAVSYSGTISSTGSATVSATTASSISASSVTLYFVTDGETVKTATVNVSQGTDGPGGFAAGSPNQTQPTAKQ